MRHYSKSSDILIYGAGGLGRELLGWIRSCRSRKSRYNPIAFIDDIRGGGGVAVAGLPVLDLRSAAGLFPECKFLVAVGEPTLRKSLATKAQAAGLKPATVLLDAVLGERVKIGPGTLVLPGSILTSDIVIGEHVLINCGSSIGHDVIIGDFCSLLGRNIVNGDVSIAELATLGAGCSVHPGVKVGPGAKVGMGSSVFVNVKAGVTVVGNPAKATFTA